MTSHAVTMVPSAPRAFAAVRARMAVADVPRRFGEFLDQVYAVRDRLPLDGQNIFVYRPVSGDEVDVEFGVGVLGDFAPVGNVYLSHLPAGRAATTTVWGPYTGIRAGHNAVIDWCRANAQKRTGTRWEVYGHWSDDPAQLRTDVFHQLD